MVEGVIFDMDGVISDTQKLHSRVEGELLSRYGVHISPEEITKQYSGVRTQEFFDDLLRKSGAENYDLSLLMAEKWQKMKELAAQSVDEVPGSRDLIQRLVEDKYPLAVASASNLNYVEQVLKTLNVYDRFSAIVSGDMVAKGKPDPESFLLAASKIGIEPEKCLVIEDGRSGMTAAKRARMYCIGLVKDLEGEYPTENKVVALSDITGEYIRRLLR